MIFIITSYSVRDLLMLSINSSFKGYYMLVLLVISFLRLKIKIIAKSIIHVGTIYEFYIEIICTIPLVDLLYKKHYSGPAIFLLSPIHYSLISCMGVILQVKLAFLSLTVDGFLYNYVDLHMFSLSQKLYNFLFTIT